MKTLREQYEAIRQEALAIPAAAEADGRKELNDAEQGRVADLLKQATDLQGQIKAADNSDAQLKQIMGLPDLKATSDDLTRRGAPANGDRSSGRKSIGDIFVESDGYKALSERGVPSTGPVVMDPVKLGGFSRLSQGQKDLVFVGDNDNADSQVPAVPPDFRGIILPTFKPLTLRQLFGSGTTTSDQVTFVREIRADRDNAAAPVAEARKSNASDDTGAEVKPESTFKFEQATADVKIIAHHIPVTRKAMADVGQVRTLIDTFLSRGLDEELEHQLMNGDGTGENLLGLGNDPDLTSVAHDTDIFTTIRNAITELQKVGVTPNAILCSPEDDAAIDLTRDDVGRFFGSGPYGVGPKQLWGIPRVTSTECTVGQAFVGDFSTAVVYDREAASIQTGTIDNQFVRNMLTVLAEMRVAFAVWEPFKIAAVDLGTESS